MINAPSSHQYRWETGVYTTREVASPAVKAKGCSAVRIDTYLSPMHSVLIFKLDVETIPEGVRVDPLLYQCAWIFQFKGPRIRARELKHFLSISRLDSGREFVALNRSVLVTRRWAIATRRAQGLVILNDGCIADIPVWYDANFRPIPGQLWDLPSDHGCIIGGTPLKIAAIVDNCFDSCKVDHAMIERALRPPPPDIPTMELNISIEEEEEEVVEQLVYVVGDGGIDSLRQISVDFPASPKMDMID
jgi:hypothetical protein